MMNFVFLLIGVAIGVVIAGIFSLVKEEEYSKDVDGMYRDAYWRGYNDGYNFKNK